MENINFADEINVTLQNNINMSWKILIVDDEQDIHEITQLSLSRFHFQERGLSFINAYSASEAIRQIEKHPDIALVLLDVVMEESDSGLKVAKYIRETLMNRSIRIIFRTGQPGYAPEDEVVINYDINDYKTKDELTSEKLFTTVICALRSYSELLKMEELVESREQAEILKDQAVQSRGLLSSAVQTMELGVTLTSIKGTILYTNSAEAAMHGYSVGELMNRDVRILAPKEMWNPIPLNERIDKRLKRRESINIHKSGTIFPVQLISNIIYNEENLPVAIVTTCEDITERKKMEKELKQLNEHLEDLIKERTSQLMETNEQLQRTIEELKQSQEQLIQSEKMASLGQLVAGIAHEINNPLGFVKSNMENLQTFTTKLLSLVDSLDNTLLPEETETKLKKQKEEIKYDYLKNRLEDIIERTVVGVNRMKEIIQDLKTFSRLDSAEFIETDINSSIDIVLGLLVHEFKDKIEIKKTYTSLPPVECYSAKLNQVFMNLLINACQAIEEKGEIAIKTAHKNGMVSIEIRDTGKGISKESMEKIFDPFYTTKPVGQGTGLGLSISYKIINAHNGEITVNSEKGKGAAFKITIPVQQEGVK